MSAAVLATDASRWFGETGGKDLTATANVGESSHSFKDMFICDTTAKHHGFTSWDRFFTRTFKGDIRTVASPDDPTIVANTCESLPYKTAHGVELRDSFRIKDQPYSLLDMLAHSPLASQFVGGTVYQAFLSALSYHRWHSPVAGRIVNAFVRDGTYFPSRCLRTSPTSMLRMRMGEGTGQGYITATATRAIIFIEAVCAEIGLMAFIGVGMAEVSTCQIWKGFRSRGGGSTFRLGVSLRV